MDYLNMYRNNESFKEYVDKIASSRDMTINQVLELAIVKIYADYIA